MGHRHRPHHRRDLRPTVQGFTPTGHTATGRIIITLTGLTLAFGETSGGMRKLIQIVFGLSIAFAATSFFLTFFSFGGGAVLF